MNNKLNELGLDASNSIVIGSGILQALGIRISKDIDLVVSQDAYVRLKESGKFSPYVNQYKKEVLIDDLFEIGTSWDVLNKKYQFDDFKDDSIVIDEVRYVTLDFLYKVKDSWFKAGTARPKDLDDLNLIEEFKNRHGNM